MIDPIFINMDYAGARRGRSPVYRCGQRRGQLTCAGPCRIRNPERTVVLSLRKNQWLAAGASPSSHNQLAPYPSDEMTCWPVSARVGNVKNNDASLIEPITAA